MGLPCTSSTDWVRAATIFFGSQWCDMWRQFGCPLLGTYAEKSLLIAQAVLLACAAPTRCGGFVLVLCFWQ